MHIRLFVCLIFICLHITTNAQVLTIDKSFNFYVDIGSNFYQEIDLDNDGQIEFLADANASSLMIIGRVNNNLVEAIAVSEKFERIKHVRYIDTDNDGQSELYVYDDMADSMYILNLPSLVTENRLKLEISDFSTVTDINYTSLNGNEEENWIITTENRGVTKMSAPDFTLIEELPESLEAKRMVVGNFDADPETEILLHNGFGSIDIINSETFVVEYEIENVSHFYDIYDLNQDGILEIYVLSSFDNEIIHYDYSKEDPVLILENLPDDYDDIYVDHREDGVIELVLYHKNDFNKDLLKLNTNPLSIKNHIDLPWKAYENSGAILANDYILDPNGDNYLFSGSSIYSVNSDNGSLTHSVYSIENINIAGFDFYLNDNVKHIMINRIEDNSGRGSEYCSFLNYESGQVERTISPNRIDPESSNASSIKSSMPSFRPKSQATMDVVMEQNYGGQVFYSPSKDKVYNTDRYDFSNIDVIDLDLDGHAELIEHGGNEITIYDTENDFDWNETLKVLVDNNEITSADLFGNEKLELLISGNQNLHVLNTETGELIELESEIFFWNIQGISAFTTNDGSPRLVVLQLPQLYIMDYPSMEILETIELEPFQNSSLEVFSMIENNQKLNYIALGGRKVKLFNESLDLLFETDDNLVASSISDIIIHDHNKNNKPNLLVSHKYGIIDYEVNLEGKYDFNYSIINSYPSHNSAINTKGSLFLQFDKAVNTEDLISSINLMNVTTGINVPISVTTINNYKFDITPLAQLEINNQYRLIVSNQLRSIVHAQLSIPYQDNNGNYFIEFTTSNSTTNTTQFDPLNEIGTLYNDSKRLFKVIITSDDQSPIRSITGGFRGVQQDSFLPQDGVYDFPQEQINILIDVFDIVPGAYQYDIISSTYDNSIDTLTLEIDVITEQGVPFKRTGINATNTYHQPQANPVNVFLEQWTFDIETKDPSGYNAIVGEGDYVYLLNEEVDLSFKKDLYLFKLNKKTGEIVYKKHLGSDLFYGSLALSEGYLYLQINGFTQNAELISIDAITGDIVWKTDFRNQSADALSPTITEDYILISGGQSGGAYCFDRWTGMEEWFVSLDFGSDWSPSVYDNTVYTSAEGIISAIDLLTGQLLWNYDTGDYSSFSDTSPTIDIDRNQIIYHNSNELLAISMSDRTINWMITFSTFAPHIVLKEEFIFMIENQTLRKVDALTGEILISTMTADCNYEIISFGNLLICNGSDGTFFYETDELEIIGSLDITNSNISIIDEYLFSSNANEVKVYKNHEGCIDFTNYETETCFGHPYLIGSFSYNTSGMYSDTIFNSTGCLEVFTLNLTVSEQVIISDTLITADNGQGSGDIAIFPQGGTIPYTYEWSNGSTTQLISDLSAGTYSVTVVDNNNCSFEFNFDVPISTSTVDIEHDLNIYPNILRVGENINIKGSYSDLTLKLFSTTGELINQTILVNQLYNIPSNLFPGFYLLEVSDSDGKQIQVYKIIIQR